MVFELVTWSARLMVMVVRKCSWCENRQNAKKRCKIAVFSIFGGRKNVFIESIARARKAVDANISLKKKIGRSTDLERKMHARKVHRARASRNNDARACMRSMQSSGVHAQCVHPHRARMHACMHALADCTDAMHAVWR